MTEPLRRDYLMETALPAAIAYAREHGTGVMLDTLTAALHYLTAAEAERDALAQQVEALTDKLHARARSGGATASVVGGPCVP